MAAKAIKRAERLKIDNDLAKAIRGRLREGKLPCAAAISLARAKGIDPLDLGRTADSLRVRLSRCQLGLFGWPGRAGSPESVNSPEEPAPEGLDAAILDGRDASGMLSCLGAWRIADDFGISRLRAGRAADRLGVRIRDCQLGVF